MADQVIYIPVILKQLASKSTISSTDIIALSDAAGNILYKCSIQQLVQNSGVSFSGNVAGIAKTDTMPADGATPESQVIYFSGPGTYDNFPDENGDPIVLPEVLNIISWDGTKATSQAIQIPLEGLTLSGGSDQTTKQVVDRIEPLEAFKNSATPAFKSIAGANKFDKATMIIPNKRYNQTTNQIEDAPTYDLYVVPILENVPYSFSGFEGVSTDHTFWGGGYMLVDKTLINPGNNESKLIYTVTANNPNGRTFISPTGKNIAFAAFTINRVVGAADTFILNDGTETITYVPYSEEFKVDPDYNDLATKEQVIGKVDKGDILETTSVNLIDPSLINFLTRYSTGSKSIIAADVNLIARTDWINVEVGKTYILFGSGVRGLPTISNVQGGYFNNYGELAAQANITFAAPVIGDGAIFQAEYPWVVLSVLKTANNDFGDYIVELAEGEIAPDYTPYELVERIKPELLPESNGGGGGGSLNVINSRAWNTFVEGFSASNVLLEKCPLFWNKWIQKEVDLTVVSTGTSEWARSLEMCTAHPKANERPPLMHSNNAASYIWDALKWDNQYYRRFDYPGYFTEVQGTWNTLSGDPLWFDTLYRLGYTRVANDNSLLGDMLKVPVPAGSNAFRYVFRTDTTGCEQIKISIDIGTQKLYVCETIDGEYVEANDCVFSIKESDPVARQIMAPNEKTGLTDTLNIATKGNSMYQKRLYFRSKVGPIDSTALDKVITFSKLTTGRFMYYGVEWSPRPVMITYINAALGSYSTIARAERGLPRVADTDMYPFRPDLIFSENPIHNDGASTVSTQQSRATLIAATYNYFFNPDYELSITTRSMALNGYVPEMIIFNSGVMQSFGSISEETGDLVVAIDKAGDMVTALDNWNAVHKYLIDEHPEVISVNSCAHMVKAAMAIYGSLWIATVASGASGSSLSNDTAHHNDLGSMLWVKTLLWIFNFLRG